MKFSRIRDLREDHDKTQKDIAEYLIMKRGVYQRYESGRREIPAWALIKLADYYQTSTDYILGRTDRREPIE
ncbi:MAG: helix-turn-helix domain-containing protein [Oscillospiraceae bacterium]|nr:helix-turn-helix transcriptional regulator [Oscillospiraceae bacterium]MDE6900504.1 helix-turn-helix domain-containing protein [Oscillospiraceae bacterium]